MNNTIRFKRGRQTVGSVAAWTPSELMESHAGLAGNTGELSEH